MEKRMTHQQLRGVVDKVIFENRESGYAVHSIDTGDLLDTIVVGHTGRLIVGQEYIFEGEWVINKRFGEQFQVNSFSEVPPSDEDAIVRYLKNTLRGIGPKMARRIVDQFGEETLSILEYEPDRLREVPGIGKATLQKIKQAYQESRGLKDLMMLLSKWEIPIRWAHKLQQELGKRAVILLQENPFELMGRVRGVGFRTADRLFQKMGGRPDDFRRTVAGFHFALTQALEEGHLYLNKDEWLERAASVLEIDSQELEKQLPRIEEQLSDKIVVEGQRVYLGWIFHIEINVAELLHRLYETPMVSRRPFRWNLIEEIELDEKQREALEKAWGEKFFILTGGPGTGKTTILKYLVKMARQEGLQVVQASPTARAAKRLEESTNFPAKTLHRLLEYNGVVFGRNEKHKLEGDLFIVDEASMIDLNLFYHFLLAFPMKRASLVLVGDPHQLPPVGVGNVLHQILQADVFPKVHLDRIFRQSESSLIVLNAHRILKGEDPIVRNKKEDDFFFLEKEDPYEVEKEIVDLVNRRIPDFKKVNPMTEIQVLSPMHKGPAGVQRLNALLQQTLNKGQKAREIAGTRFRLGDKVMQTVNNYERGFLGEGIMNGEIGLIVTAGNSIKELKQNCIDVSVKKRLIDLLSLIDSDTRERLDLNFSLIVDYDGLLIPYEKEGLEEISLAYCCTVHKSQGSEYPVVICPLLTNHYVMLKRNLLYTAVTRAKNLCILIGQRKALRKAIEDNELPRLNASLWERIRERSKRPSLWSQE